MPEPETMYEAAELAWQDDRSPGVYREHRAAFIAGYVAGRKAMRERCIFEEGGAPLLEFEALDAEVRKCQ